MKGWKTGLPSALLLACQPVVVTTPTPAPAPTVVAAPPVENRSEVQRACDWFREHDCVEGRPTPEGASCEQVLGNAAANGIDLVGDVECILRAADCEAAARCP